MPVPVYGGATDSTGHFQTDMKGSLVFLLILTLCFLCRAQKLRTDNDITLQTAESWEETAPIQIDSEGHEQEPVSLKDIWAELRNLRDMVVEQTVELRHLTTRVTAAESLVDELQTEKTGTPS